MYQLEYVYYLVWCDVYHLMTPMEDNVSYQEMSLLYGSEFSTSEKFVYLKYM